MAISDSAHEVIAETVREILSTHGPMHETALLALLNTENIDLGPDPDVGLADVLDHGAELFMPLADGRWAWIPGLLNGRVFTHRLSSMEVDYDVLGLGTDLAPLAMLAHSGTYQRLTDGSPITEVCYPHLDSHVLAARDLPAAAVTGDGILLLPPGRFAALGAVAGDLVGLRVRSNGFELAVVTAPMPCGTGAALAGLLAQRPNRPEMLDVAVWTICANDNTAFGEAVKPLGELLCAGDLDCEGSWVAHRGFDFGSLRVTGRIEIIKNRHQLGDNEAAAVLAMVRLYEHVLDAVYTARAVHGSNDEHALISVVSQHAPRLDPTSWGDQDRDDRPAVRATLEFLADPAVAAAVLAETSLEHDHSAIGWGVFAESTEPWAPSTARPALRWLRAKAYERLGEIERAEATLHAAESLDPSWPLTLMSLARYASDRGDAKNGLALLRRAGVSANHELAVLLEHFQPTDNAQLPLERRATWLYQKAGMNLLEGPFGPLLIEIAQVRARRWDAPGALGRALHEGLASDVVLFEGGAFAHFLTTRGWLLPPDEQMMAQQWLLAPRCVHEVLAISPGQGITLRNMHTEEVCEVHERVDSTQLVVGELYCARVVCTGTTMQIFGRIEPVSRNESTELIALLNNDPDPLELITALSHRFAPPPLQISSGKP
ncbi:MAG: hypothetical protein K2Q25_11540 [Mycobacteriaceae bacterium]|nr:hypothetical protein [Mycobacteriaceae bacterium]